MIELTAYISRINLFASFAKVSGKTYDVNNLNDQDRKDLLKRVDIDLSPENLTCDGEIRGEALKVKAAKLQAVRRQLTAM